MVFSVATCSLISVVDNQWPGLVCDPLSLYLLLVTEFCEWSGCDSLHSSPQNPSVARSISMLPLLSNSDCVSLSTDKGSPVV